MKPNLTIVTAASSNHFNCLVNLLWSAALNEPRARVIVWDIGLLPDERAWLENDVPPFSWRGEVRSFDFASHPQHFSMKQFAGRLAWRPVAVLGALEEFGGHVLWLDAGCWVTAPLERVRGNMVRDGVHSRVGPGTIAGRLAPSSFSALGVLESDLTLPMREAGITGFNAADSKAMALARRWAAVAMDPAAMDPAGSNRRTHRQDAVFSVLFHQVGYRHDSSYAGEIAIRRDDVPHAEARFRLSPGRTLPPPSDDRPPSRDAGYWAAIRRAAGRI